MNSSSPRGSDQEFSPESLSRPQSVLQIALFALAGGQALASAVSFVQGWDLALRINTFAMSTTMIGLALLLCGRALTGLAVASFGAITGVLLSAFLQTGIRNIAIPALPMIVIVASLLLNRRLLGALTVYAIGGVWTMTAVRWTNGSEMFSANTVGDLIILTMVVLMASAVGLLFSSEVKRQICALHESDEFRKRIFESSRIPIVVVDAQTLEFVDCNNAASEMFGFPGNEILGKTPADLSERLQPDGRASRYASIEYSNRALREGSAVFEWQFRKAPHELWYAEVHLIHFESNGRDYLQATLENITARVLGDLALRQSEQRYASVAQCFPDAIWMVDLDGRFIYTNPAVERIYGWKQQEMLMLSFRDTTVETEAVRYQAMLAAEIKKAESPNYDRNTVVTFESEQKRRDGSHFWSEINASLMWGPDGRPNGALGTTRDITERRRAQEEREKLTAELAQAQKLESVGRLAAGVAHDFNNLLTLINGYTRMTMDRLSLEDPLHSNLEEVLKAGNRAASLTSQLLAFSRRQVLIPCTLDLNRVVGDIRRMLERLMDEDIQVRVRLTAEPVTISADQHQLEQVIMNLAVNSRDAMPRGGLFTIETSVASGCALIAVSDTGIGMDQVTRGRIFEPFFTTKEAGRGTGLGLSMVQGFVLQSGGRIEVSTELNRGTTFRIFLPLVAVTGAENGGSAAKSALNGSETVLVVEDQADVRNYVVSALRKYGYKVMQAEGPGEALQLLERDSTPVDLVVTDVMMPLMSGPELALRIEQLRPGCKLLFISGCTNDEYLKEFSERDPNTFLQKPFSPIELATSVRSVLAAVPAA